MKEEEQAALAEIYAELEADAEQQLRSYKRLYADMQVVAANYKALYDARGEEITILNDLLAEFLEEYAEVEE